MAKDVNPPRGNRDFLPLEKQKREQVLGVIVDTYRQHGFQQIEAPVMEDLARLTSGQGGDNEKIAFRVMKRGEELERALADNSGADNLADLGLRYDLTVPLTRFYATNRAKLPNVFKAIQTGPVFRAERPQKGRYRQFVQCDIDIIGDPGILAEIELINASLDALNAIGLSEARIRFYDRRLLEAGNVAALVPEENAIGALIELDKMDKKPWTEIETAVAALSLVGSQSEKYFRSVLQPVIDAQNMALKPLLDAQKAALKPAMETLQRALSATSEMQRFADSLKRAVAESLPIANAIGYGLVDGKLKAQKVPMAEEPVVQSPASPIERSIDEAFNDLVAIKSAIEARHPGRLRFDPSLVRGMGYYTGTIFEIEHPDSGSSIGGGGRYDGMVGRWLGQDVPAVGISIGFERAVDLVDDSLLGAAEGLVLVLEDDSAEVLASALLLQGQLIEAGEPQVRLERRPKKLNLLLENLAEQGFGRFAFVGAESAAAGVAGLQIKDIA